jgi:hypothetical protein
MGLNFSNFISLSLSLGLFSVLFPIHAQAQRDRDSIVIESVYDAVLVYCSLKEEGASEDRALNSATDRFMERMEKKAGLTKPELVILYSDERFKILYAQAFFDTVADTCPEYLE